MTKIDANPALVDELLRSTRGVRDTQRQVSIKEVLKATGVSSGLADRFWSDEPTSVLMSPESAVAKLSGLTLAPADALVDPDRVLVLLRQDEAAMRDAIKNPWLRLGLGYCDTASEVAESFLGNDAQPALAWLLAGACTLNHPDAEGGGRSDVGAMARAQRIAAVRGAHVAQGRGPVVRRSMGALLYVRKLRRVCASEYTVELH